MGEHIYESGTYMITLRLPDEAIEDIGQSGQNDEAVAHWHGKLADQFTTIDREKLIAELLEYGCWDEVELRSDPELTEQRPLIHPPPMQRNWSAQFLTAGFLLLVMGLCWLAVRLFRWVVP